MSNAIDYYFDLLPRNVEICRGLSFQKTIFSSLVPEDLVCLEHITNDALTMGVVVTKKNITLGEKVRICVVTTNTTVFSCYASRIQPCWCFRELRNDHIVSSDFV